MSCRAQSRHLVTNGNGFIFTDRFIASAIGLAWKDPVQVYSDISFIELVGCALHKIHINSMRGKLGTRDSYRLLRKKQNVTPRESRGLIEMACEAVH
jgi:hypothetical protein